MEKLNLVKRIRNGIAIFLLGGAVTGAGICEYLNSEVIHKSGRIAGDALIRTRAVKRMEEIANPDLIIKAQWSLNRSFTCKGKDISPILKKYEEQLGSIYFNPNAWADKTGEIYVSSRNLDSCPQSDPSDPYFINPRSEEEIARLTNILRNFSEEIYNIDRKYSISK